MIGVPRYWMQSQRERGSNLPIPPGIIPFQLLRGMGIEPSTSVTSLGGNSVLFSCQRKKKKSVRIIIIEVSVSGVHH